MSGSQKKVSIGALNMNRRINLIILKIAGGVDFYLKSPFDFADLTELRIISALYEVLPVVAQKSDSGALLP